MHCWEIKYFTLEKKIKQFAAMQRFWVEEKCAYFKLYKWDTLQNYDPFEKLVISVNFPYILYNKELHHNRMHKLDVSIKLALFTKNTFRVLSPLRVFYN